MAAYILILQRALRRERIFRDRTNPLDSFTDEEIYRGYRFTRTGICHLTDTFGALLSRKTRRNRPLPPSLQILVTLRFYATGTAQHAFAETVSAVIARVTEVAHI